jgi:hypothetical protein
MTDPVPPGEPAGDGPPHVRRALAPFDTSKPNVARTYDYFLGGKDNFAADREYARMADELAPGEPAKAARACREFLRRAVRYLVGEAGITQLLDIGAGLPTQGNVSEVAHEIDPDVRVVHVDNDPVVYTHSKALLACDRTTDFMIGDVRRPAEILSHPVVARLIDMHQPVGLLLFSVLHHVEDADKPGVIMDELRGAMPSGSYLAIVSFRLPSLDEPQDRVNVAEIERQLVGKLGSGRWREDAEIASWFGDWEMIEPGLVPLLEWRPPLPLPHRLMHDGISNSHRGGVARKP